MIVTCPRCLTKFNLPEDKLTPDTKLNLHCSRCGSEFLFSPQYPDDDQESSATPAPTIPEELETVPELETNADLTKDTAGETESVATSMPAGEEIAIEKREELTDSTSFEMADDFGDVEELTLDEPTDSQEETSETAEKVEDKKEDQEIEELALDIDDLDLDDIEFDSFEDEPATADDLKEDQKELQKGRQTQIDNDDDLDDLLKQAEELPSDEPTSTIEKETGKQTETDTSGKDSDASPDLIKTSKVSDKKRSIILVLTCFVVLSLALWTAYGLWQRFSVDMVKHLSLVEIENQRLRLPSERIVIVLRGKIVNSSNKLVTDLKIKGILLDSAGQAVAEVVTAGGVSFSEEELDLLDADKLAMLENTTVTLPPSGELPFMIAFYDYPEGARTCYVELSSFKVKKGPRP